MADARFEDGGDGPLRLKAETAEDVTVISALAQDAVLTARDASWLPRKRRFAVLLNRFRWEDREAAEAEGRPYERVRFMLVADHVLRVRSSGLDPADKDVVLSLLSVEVAQGEDGAATLTLHLAGDGAFALDVEALELTLRDVTRPYRALAKSVPSHEGRD